MFEWLVEKFIAVLDFVPALIVAEHSPNFMLGRILMGLIFIIVVVYLIAMRPFRSVMARCFKKATNFIRPKC